MSEYLKLIRVKHWLKNILVFLPVFFSMNLLNTNLLLFNFYAFIIFCLCSSIVYIINDICDIDIDKKHPIKKARPLASGKISIKNAYLMILVLLVLILVFIILIYTKIKSLWTFFIPIIYVLINILYSKKLKNIPIIDVVTIVIGFVLRVIYGGVVTNIEVSKYLHLMIMFGAFYLGFGKRRNEILKNGDKSRAVLKFYSKEFLDKNMYISFALAIVSYTLWCVDPTTILRIGNEYIFWTIPLVMIILQRYSLDIEGNSYGDPIDVILSDKLLLLMVFIYGGVMILLLYVIK